EAEHRLADDGDDGVGGRIPQRQPENRVVEGALVIRQPDELADLPRHDLPVEETDIKLVGERVDAPHQRERQAGQDEQEGHVPAIVRPPARGRLPDGRSGGCAAAGWKLQIDAHRHVSANKQPHPPTRYAVSLRPPPETFLWDANAERVSGRGLRFDYGRLRRPASS